MLYTYERKALNVIWQAMKIIIGSTFGTGRAMKLWYLMSDVVIM